jgi:hypothetical protein
MHLTYWQIMTPFWKGFFTPVIWLYVFIGILSVLIVKIVFKKIEEAIRRKRK